MILRPWARAAAVLPGPDVLGAGLGVLAAGRLLPPRSPAGLARAADALLRWGTTPALGFALGAARHPSAPAVVDAGPPGGGPEVVVTFAQAEGWTAAAAAHLRGAGPGPGGVVALLGRNSWPYLLALVGAARAGCDVVYLNAGWTAAQVRQACADHRVDLLLHDADLAGRVPPLTAALRLEDLAAATGPDAVPAGGPRPPLLDRPGRHVILTSGTTGAPRGAARDAASFDAAVALLAAFPLRSRGVHVLASPLFHSWAWLHHRLCAPLDATQVLLPRPEPLRLLELVARHRADVVVTVPVVLERMLAVGGDRRAALDLSSLRCVAVSGAPVPVDLAGRFRAAFGDVLYDLYGSTEAAFATVAAPADLRAAPGTVGRALPGVRVEVRDAAGAPVPAGAEGRIYVGSRTSFAGYTDGGDRERVDGLVWTGDLGHQDAAGRLFVAGRADDVIVSRGENVHPAEVERALAGLPGVEEVAVVGEPGPGGDRHVAAYVVGPADPAEVLDAARALLAPYQRPRRVVRVAALPRNATGKVRRLDLSAVPVVAEAPG